MNGAKSIGTKIRRELEPQWSEHDEARVLARVLARRRAAGYRVGSWWGFGAVAAAILLVGAVWTGVRNYSGGSNPNRGYAAPMQVVPAPADEARNRRRVSQFRA